MLRKREQVVVILQRAFRFSVLGSCSRPLRMTTYRPRLDCDARHINEERRCKKGDGTTETVHQFERSHPETEPQYVDSRVNRERMAQGFGGLSLDGLAGTGSPPLRRSLAWLPNSGSEKWRS
jgi:hypothetical protein